MIVVARRLLMALGVALIVLLGTVSQATAAPAASTTAVGSSTASTSTLSTSASKTVPHPNIWGTYGYYPDAYTCNSIGQYAVNTGQARAYDCYNNGVYPNPWVLNVDFS